MDISAARALFPVTSRLIYLNNAAESPLNIRVRERLEEYLALAADAPHRKPVSRRAVRSALCDLFGGAPEDYALVTSTGVGVGIVAAGYPWKPGDNLVVPAGEHWNNTFPWLALRERGVEVRLAPVGPDQRVDPRKIAALVDGRTRILAAAAVRFDTGFRVDLDALSRIAHDRGALFLVDGIQGAGVFPIDVKRNGIDILACAGFKWLLGMPGTGFLYLNRRAQKIIRPVLPGMFAAEDDTRELRYFDDARRYETGSIAYPLFHAWTAGLELLQEVGIENIYTRVMQLTGRIIAGLHAWQIEIISPYAHLSERSAIISFTLGTQEANKNMHQALAAKGILTALRDGRIRVSPNFFNTEDEIDRFLYALYGLYRL